MAVHESPPGIIPAEDQRDSQRPVLGWEVPDGAVLALDGHEDREITGGVRLDELELALSSSSSAKRSAVTDDADPPVACPPNGDSSVKSSA
jgi:hypothetical protein